MRPCSIIQLGFHNTTSEISFTCSRFTVKVGFCPLQAVYLWRSECPSLSLPSSTQQWGQCCLPHGLEDSMRWLMPRTQHSAWHMAAFGECSFLSLSLLLFTLAQVPPLGSFPICATILDADNCSRIDTWLTPGELGAYPLFNSHIFILPSLECPWSTWLLDGSASLETTGHWQFFITLH